MAIIGYRKRLTQLRDDPVSVDVWPGFVDALANVIIVMVFVLLVFVLAQFYLGSALSGRNSELFMLNSRLEQLGQQLSLERRLSETLQTQQIRLQATLENTQLQLTKEQQALALEQNQRALIEQQRDSATLREQASVKKNQDMVVQMALANDNITALEKQIESVRELLSQSNTQKAIAEERIENLNTQLNDALAKQVQELSRYRSDFFGRMRDLLGSRGDITVVGDRFVFQSEVFFSPGSAEIGAGGRETLTAVASSLQQITEQIPQDIPWLLQVEGHTDSIPISNEQYPSNWELSTARAISVVRFLIQQGIDEKRLVAAGFAEFQPLDPSDSPESRRRNRRIELRLSQI